MWGPRWNDTEVVLLLSTMFRIHVGYMKSQCKIDGGDDGYHYDNECNNSDK